MTTELVVAAAVLAIGAVFVCALRFVTRRWMRPPVPVATIVDGAGPRWLAGRGRARAVRGADTFQRFAIAFALTSIVVMIACGIGMIVLAVVANA